MNRKTLAYIAALIVLILLVLWWTRYQVLGEVGGDVKAVAVINRFTGDIWIISPMGSYKTKWIEQSQQKQP